MIKIRKTWLIGILLIIALAGYANAQADDVCVVVQDQSDVNVDSESDCDDVDADDATIKDAIDAIITVEYALDNESNPTHICSAEGIGSCPADELKVYLLDNGWKEIAFSNIDTTQVDDDDVIALVLGNEGLISGSEPEMLKISKIIITVDGDKNTFDENEVLDEDSFDIEPGSEVEVKVELENKFPKDTKISIDVEFEEFVIENIDDGDDLEPEDDIEDLELDADKDETVTAEFRIPLLVEDEDEQPIVIEITAEDEEGGEYDLLFDNFIVVVDKESHKLIFNRAELSKAAVSCDRSTMLDVEIINTGADDEDVILTIRNDDLDIDEREEFELEEADDDDAVYENSWSLDLGEDVKAETYKIALQAKYGARTASKTLELKVEDCAAPPPKEVEEEEEEEEEVEVIVGEGEAEGEIILEEPTWLEQNQYVVVLVLAIIVVILLIIWVVTAMKK